MQRAFLRTRWLSFRYAFAGIAYVFRTQKNAWIHALATLLVVAMGLWLKISATGWAVLILTIAVVWSAECFNTAVEATIDLVSPQKHPLAKIAKDTAAAGVLFAAIGSVGVGLFLFGPPLYEKVISLF
ncbi:diacylglycerol kinase [Longilinea arvoryzae]|uniref:Diacylglycerol kinase n=1 Tax=Longilinea arvoryzae TaxID=360412 RepID=A0A0S7BAZ4_9CHLR|nr:diacylglycerol kinase family protein [Longilinea arvoryzae]GAP14718.1 diacylglycerol kinase [Longilinea arvoryzae]